MSSSVQSCIKKNLNWLWAQFIFNLKYELHCHSDTLAIGPVPFLHCTTSSAKPQQNNKAPSVSRFSHSLMPDSFRPCGLQHTRPPCPSPTPRACSNSCPLSRWCHPAVSSSVVPSPPAFTLSQHQGLFQWVSSLHQVAKGLEFQFQHQSFQWIIRLISFRIDLFDCLALQGTLKSLLQHHSSKASNSLALGLLYGSSLTSVHDYWKNRNFVIAFLPRDKHLLISWLQSLQWFGSPRKETLSLFPLFSHLFAVKR